MDKNTNQEKRAYCSYLWDTQDVVNCCLELMACATSLLTYKECKNVEIQNLSKDILSKVSSYMVELTSDTNEQRSINEVVETIDEVVETIEDRAKDEELDEKCEEKEESDEEPKKSEEKTDKKEEKSDKETDKDEKSDKETEEDEEKEESDEKRGLSPEDELLLLRARLSNLK